MSTQSGASEARSLAQGLARAAEMERVGWALELEIAALDRHIAEWDPDADDSDDPDVLTLIQERSGKREKWAANREELLELVQTCWLQCAHINAEIIDAMLIHGRKS